MTSIAQYKSDIIKYDNLKNNLNSILNILSSAIDDADNLNSEIKSRYLINDNPAVISSSVTSFTGDMKETYNYLNNVVIPAIDSSLASTQAKKARLERIERERKEKEKREEQERMKENR